MSQRTDRSSMYRVWSFPCLPGPARQGPDPSDAPPDLRHGLASLLLAQGVTARVVMEVLGHSQISMTMDTYSHVAPALLGDAAKAMNASLRPA